MAFHADTVWEVRTSGNNNNGGGWRDGGGGSVDYSQQDVAQLNLANCSVSGTTLTDDDAGGVFTAAMVWNIVNIVGDERRQIISFTDVNNVELDAAPGDATGLTINVGGAVADLEELNPPLTGSGNTIHVKAGTYVASGAITLFTGTSSALVRITGYNTSRGDDPTGGNRPLLQMGTYRLTKGSSVHFKNFEITADDYVLSYGIGLNENIKITGRFEPGGEDVSIQCEFTNPGGTAVDNPTQPDTQFERCYIHDCVIGISVQYRFFTVTNCIFDTCSSYGIVIAGINATHAFNISHNSFYNCGDALYAGYVCYSGNIRNNQFTDCVDAIHFTSPSPSLFIDYNNYYNNSGNDVTNANKGENATAQFPGYNNAPAGDFSDVNDADGEILLYGVG